MKIQIIGLKVYFNQQGKTMLGDVNKLFVFKSLLLFSGPYFGPDLHGRPLIIFIPGLDYKKRSFEA